MVVFTSISHTRLSLNNEIIGGNDIKSKNCVIDQNECIYNIMTYGTWRTW